MISNIWDRLKAAYGQRPRAFIVAASAIVVVAAAGAVAAIVLPDDESSTRTAVRRVRSPYRVPGGVAPPGAQMPSGLAAFGASGDAPGRSGRRSVSRQIIVRFEPAASRAKRATIRDRFDLDLIRSLDLPGAELAEITSDRDANQVQAALEAEPAVLYAEPNFIYTTMRAPDDPRFPELWGLHNTGQSVNGRTGIPDADVDAPEAWDTSTGSSQVTVAVVDTGVAHAHPDLASNIWTNRDESWNGIDDDNNGYIDDVRGWDFVSRDADPSDLNGHGSHVAGTIGGRGGNATGISGINWQTGIMPLRVLDSSGAGSSANIASAFAYAGSKGAHVVNASLGGPSFSQAILDTIVRYPRTLFVVAAGNSSANNDVVPTYPCNYPVTNLICVAATTQTDSLASFSNYGAVSVDLGAPGAFVLSTLPAFSAPFADSFETDLTERWLPEPSGWGRGLDAMGYFASDSPGGNYGPNANSSLVSSPFDLSGMSACGVDYFMRLQTEKDNDGLLIEASNGGQNWAKIAGWTGSTEGKWVPVSSDLTQFDGASSVHLRLRLVSNESVELDGADLDDVRVRCVSGSFTGSEYGYASGTSMAAPQVAGAAALLWSAAPGASATEIKDALLAGVDRIDALVGKTLTGGRLNAASAMVALGVAAPPSEQAPSPAPTPAPQGGGGGGGAPPPPESPSASESPSPTPTPSISPPAPAEASPAPEESPEPSPPGTHDRSVSLRLRRHLVARGRVIVADGYTACADGVPIKIRRNGAVIARTTTDEGGFFKVRLPDRAGRYVVVAPPVQESEDRCARDRSRVARHRHR